MSMYNTRVLGIEPSSVFLGIIKYQKHLKCVDKIEAYWDGVINRQSFNKDEI